MAYDELPYEHAPQREVSVTIKFTTYLNEGGNIDPDEQEERLVEELEKALHGYELDINIQNAF